MLTQNSILLYNRILSKFPQSFSFVFAYGSGVKKQLGYENVKKQSMIDFLFCVKNTNDWHSENLIRNSSHYSGIKYFGSDFITVYQEKLGAKIYCNTLIPFGDNGLKFKYGVISENNLRKDLLEWSDLYSAGRLHKPRSTVFEANKELQQAIQINLNSAVHTALLFLPEKFTNFELFYTISNLSYAGDFRMIFGENKNKVKNIVEPQMNDFIELYKPSLNLLKEHVSSTSEGGFIQNIAADSREHHFRQLPDLPKNMMLQKFHKGQSDKDIFQIISSNPNSSEELKKCLRSIVFKSSATQSIKNIPTAGLTKSIVYSWKKSLKTFNL